jgi:hypothetical protein
VLFNAGCLLSAMVVVLDGFAAWFPLISVVLSAPITWFLLVVKDQAGGLNEESYYLAKVTNRRVL